MTGIFLSYAQENAACAEQIRSGLEAQGYTIWHEPTNSTSTSYPDSSETAVLDSAAVVLLWSQYTSQAASVERHLLFAQSLKKPVFPLILDGTSLPDTLVSANSLTVEVDCTHAVSTLIALPAFPPAHSTDPLITPPALSPADAQPIFGVRCKNGHVSYFDKRVVCAAHTSFPRGYSDSAGKELDELDLTCQTCGEEIVAHVDCEGYR